MLGRRGRESPDQRFAVRAGREVFQNLVQGDEHDAESDTLTVIFREGASVQESDEVKPGFIVDIGQDGDVVSIEVLDASRRVSDARHVDYKLQE